MSAYVLSVNVGSAEPNPAKGVGVTGIGKRPVVRAELRDPGPRRGGLGSGLVGDFIGDVANHGGDRQAVYAFAREELDGWAARLGRPLPNGVFGENLTTQGLAVDDALVGDQWQVGSSVVLEVTGPRIPCATFQHRMQEPGWVRRFTEHGLSGAYLSVVEAGTVSVGDRVDVRQRAGHRITLVRAFRAFTGDLDAAEQVLASGCLPAEEEDWLRARVERRR